MSRQILVVLLVTLVGCGTATPIPATPTVIPPTQVPSATSAPSPTTAPSPTSAPTETSEPTATAAPSATSAPTHTTAPSPTSAPTEPPATATPAAPAIQSGGIGLSRAEWEAAHGVGKDAFGFLRYEDVYNVSYHDDHISYLERQYRGAPVSLSDARIEAKTLLPADAALVETYEPREMRIADLHMSAALIPVFPVTEEPFGNPWIGGEPGQVLALYRLDGNMVTSFVLALGNNP